MPLHAAVLRGREGARGFDFAGNLARFLPATCFFRNAEERFSLPPATGARSKGALGSRLLSVLRPVHPTRLVPSAPAPAVARPSPRLRGTRREGWAR